MQALYGIFQDAKPRKQIGMKVIAETFGFTDASYSRVIFSNSRMNDLISVLETFSKFK